MSEDTGDLTASLQQIRSKAVSARELEEVGRLEQFWSTFNEALAREVAGLNMAEGPRFSRPQVQKFGPHMLQYVAAFAAGSGRASS